MKNLFFLSVVYLLITLNSSTLKGQTVQWAKKGISEGFENGNAICTDDSGNVYVTGQLEFTSVFDHVTLHAYGQHDIFVAKYNTNGALLWIRQAGGPGGDIGNGIGIDAQHNVYVTGEYEDSAKFGTINIVTSGGNDGFLAKYDLNGNIIWVKSFGCPTSSDKGRALAVSPSGNTYITGNFSSTGTFDSLVLNANGANDIFVVKYNTNGDAEWAKKAGGSKQDRGYGLAIDANENIFVTGTFTQSASFSGTTITNTGFHSSFVAKYSSLGNFEWVKEAGACCDTTKSNAVALDENGNIYISGYFMDSTQFGAIALNVYPVDSLPDAFIAKYDPAGNVVWAKHAGGNDEDAGYGVAVDTLNHLVYTTGLVRTNGYFDNLPYSIAGYKDVFVAAYDMNGNAQWVRTYGGNRRDAGAAITVGPNGYIYSTGLFNDNAQFGSFILTGYPNQPWADFYVNKISPAMAAVPTIAPSALLIGSGNCSDIQLNFTPGNGMRRIIVCHEGSPVNAFPANGNIYTANNSFGTGSNLGNNNFVVYNGSGNNVTITNLHPGSTYYFSIFEYNGHGIASSYMLSANANVNAVASVFPINLTMPSTTICDGEQIQINASGAQSYAWLPNSSITIINDSMVTANPNVNTTYTVSGTTNAGCYAENTFTLVVNPKPSVSFASLSPVCLNNTPITLSQGSPANGIYSGPGVTAGVFNPSSTGSGIFTLTYEYTDMNGCTGTAQTSIQVRSIPGVLFNPIPFMCDNASPVALTNGSPAGGVYSGPGINAGVFDPSIGQGAHLINYSYTNSNGCTGTANGYIVVKTSPNVSIGSNQIVCAANSIQINATPGMTTYSWSTGATTPSITLDSSGIGLGTANIYVIASNSDGCTDSDIIQVTFDLCAGIDQPKNTGAELSVYPSPFNSSITVESAKTIKLTIYDDCGRMIEQKSDFSGSMTLGEGLPAGTYFIEAISGSTKKIYPVIKTSH